MATSEYSLPQAERINSKKQIDRLFRGGGSRAMSAAPLRVVYMSDERGEGARGPMAQMLVSVPKRYFKRAVKRNRIKRQVREAYRLNKHLLTDILDEWGNTTVSMCFIWSADSILATSEVEERMRNLLVRVGERLQKAKAGHEGTAVEGGAV